MWLHSAATRKLCCSFCSITQLHQADMMCRLLYTHCTRDVTTYTAHWPHCTKASKHSGHEEHELRWLRNLAVLNPTTTYQQWHIQATAGLSQPAQTSLQQRTTNPTPMEKHTAAARAAARLSCPVCCCAPAGTALMPEQLCARGVDASWQQLAEASAKPQQQPP